MYALGIVSIPSRMFFGDTLSMGSSKSESTSDVEPTETAGLDRCSCVLNVCSRDSSSVRSVSLTMAGGNEEDIGSAIARAVTAASCFPMSSHVA